MTRDGFHEIRDGSTGRFIVRYNPRTGEVQRQERGKVLRGKLTKPPRPGYPSSSSVKFNNQ